MVRYKKINVNNGLYLITRILTHAILNLSFHSSLFIKIYHCSSVPVYYLRAKAHAQRGMVKILREMLAWEAKDKEFLLQRISKVTKGRM